MSRIVLVRHAQPDIDPAKPAHAWPLSPDGRASALAIAPAIRALGVDRIVASTEPKAYQTAELIAAELALPQVVRFAGFAEHQRYSVPYLSDPDEFRRQVVRCLRRPDDCVFGDETARAALERFAAELDTRRSQYKGERLAVVTHGTVMSLYAARVRGADPVDIWKQLMLPDVLAL